MWLVVLWYDGGREEKERGWLVRGDIVECSWFVHWGLLWCEVWVMFANL